MAGELYVPDFSLVRELLELPCPDPAPAPALRAANPTPAAPSPNPGARTPVSSAESWSESNNTRPKRPEMVQRPCPFTLPFGLQWGVSPRSMASSPVPLALRLLQETAELLPKPPGPAAPGPGRPPPALPHFPPALPEPGCPLDPLTLLTLECHGLAAPGAPRPCYGQAVDPPKQGRGGGRAPRKQLRPTKGAVGLDPGFEGVALRIRLNLVCEEPRLVITSSYSKGMRKAGVGPDPPRRKYEAYEGEPGPYDGDPSGGKRCASCQTQHTPLWREAQDGTLLCNACGIRYRKYKIRCARCCSVPRRGLRAPTLCSSCGGVLCLPQPPLGAPSPPGSGPTDYGVASRRCRMRTSQPSNSNEPTSLPPPAMGE